MLRRLVLMAACVALIVLGGFASSVRAFNVCSTIGRCSECVFDQTDGLMPPPLMCGWCESTKTCKEVNSTVLSYYRSSFPSSSVYLKDAEVIEHTPAEIAAFRKAFCEDFREREFNPVCPDMFCAASRTTNNIYICRVPSIIALVFGCILFVLSMFLYLWMQTIRQLPWRYEPFLSDLLAGRQRLPPDSACDDGAGRGDRVLHITAATPYLPLVSEMQSLQDSRGVSFRNHDSITESFGERDGGDRANGVGGGACGEDDRASPSPAAPQSGRTADPPDSAIPLSGASRMTPAAVSGHCPICKCSQPVRLGPGDVCFWCNVARFAFVPFSLALLSSLIVVVLSFAVSLKPWFSDAYFGEVLVVAYLTLAGFILCVVRNHRRVPLFCPAADSTREKEAVRVASPALHSPRCTAPSPSVTASTSPLQQVHEAKLRLLNDAQRNMASTTYMQLAFRLRGQSLLDQIPDLRLYHSQLESMRVPKTVVVAAAAALGGAEEKRGAPEATTTGMNTHDVTVSVPLIADYRQTISGAAAAHQTLIQGNTTARVGTASNSVSTAAASSHASLPLQTTHLAPRASVHPILSPLAPPATEVREGDSMDGRTMCTFLPATPTASAAPVTSAAPTAASSSPTAVPGPVVSELPERVVRQKRGETAQLLHSDFLPVQYRKALKVTLSTGEFITWCSKPQIRGVLRDNEWLLVGLLAGFLFGIWMLLLSSVTDRSYAIVRLIGSTAVAACGLVVMVGFAVLLIVVIRSCGRLYVLTNERLITVCEGLVELVVTSTDLSSVRFAALYGYRSIWSREPVMDFSWEIPASERKMPVISSHKFAGIVNVHEFLYYFRMVAPQMPSHLQQISESTRACRVEWRMHMVLGIGSFIALPIVTVYPHAIPDILAAYLYVVLLLLIYSTLLRGLRIQQMTCAPLNVAASWVPGRLWSDVEGEGAQRPLPSLIAQAPNAYVIDIATPSSMGNTKESQDSSKVHVSRPPLPTEPNSRVDLYTMDTEFVGATNSASTVRVCRKISKPPSSPMRPSTPGTVHHNGSDGCRISRDAVAHGTAVPKAPG